MAAIGKILSGPKEDGQLAADRAEARRLAEEEKARADAKAANLRSARMSGSVGYASLLSAGTAGGGQQAKKSLLG